MAVLSWLVAAVSCADGFDAKHCRASFLAAIAASHSNPGTAAPAKLAEGLVQGHNALPMQPALSHTGWTQQRLQPCQPWGSARDDAPHQGKHPACPFGNLALLAPLSPNIFPLPQALTFPTEILEIGWIIYWLFPDCCLFGEIILEIRC